ncbi:MAG: hypothetical protein WC178_01200 [Candidatus Paceibacterota bacterium]
MNGAIKGLLAMLAILLSIGNVAATDLSNFYDGNDEDVNDEIQQLESQHRAQRLFKLMQVGSDLYAVDACNNYIIECVEKNIISWSDLGIAGGREYLILASDCRRLSIEKARQSLDNDNIGEKKRLMSYESISAWEDVALDQQTRAKNLFQVIQRAPDYYTIVGYDQFIRNSVAEGAVSWSDLGLEDEIDYELVVCDSKRQSALNAWAYLTSGDVKTEEEAIVCRESIFAAIENGDLKEGDDISWCTAGAVADRLIVKK